MTVPVRMDFLIKSKITKVNHIVISVKHKNKSFRNNFFPFQHSSFRKVHIKISVLDFNIFNTIKIQLLIPLATDEVSPALVP